MKKYGILIVIFLLLAAGYGLYLQHGNALQDTGDREEEKGHYPVTISNYTSSGEAKDYIFTRRPQRVAVDRSNNLEILLALGLSDRISMVSVRHGNESYEEMEAAYGEEMEKIPGIHNTTYEDFDMETVLASQPELIMGWQSTFGKSRLRSTGWWNEKGINTYISPSANSILERRTVDDEIQFIDDVGRIFDKKEQTDAMIGEIRKEVKRVREETEGKPAPRVVVMELLGKDISNYSDRTTAGNMVTELGGRMLLDSRRIGREDLLEADPDVIFVVYLESRDKERVLDFFRKPEVSSMKAVQGNRIYFLQLDNIYCPGVRTIKGLKLIRDGMYPELKGKS